MQFVVFPCAKGTAVALYYSRQLAIPTRRPESCTVRPLCSWTCRTWRAWAAADSLSRRSASSSGSICIVSLSLFDPTPCLALRAALRPAGRWGRRTITSRRGVRSEDFSSRCERTRQSAIWPVRAGHGATRSRGRAGAACAADMSGLCLCEHALRVESLARRGFEYTKMSSLAESDDANRPSGSELSFSSGLSLCEPRFFGRGHPS